MSSASPILMAIVAVVGLYLFFWLLGRPIKWAFKLLINAICGVFILFLVNFLGAIIGVSLEITWLNAIVAGIFGTPGVIVLLVLKYLL